MTSIAVADKPSARLDADGALAVARRLPSVALVLGLLGLFGFYFLRIHDRPTILMNYIPFASARFAEDGFIHHRFTPPFPNMWSNSSASEHIVWYTHYPPLPFYVGALLWKWGATTKAALAVFFNIIALAYVLLLYRVLSLLLNQWIACISVLVLASHPVFIEQVLENYLNLSLFFQAAAFLFLIHALNSTIQRQRYLYFLCTWVCLFGDAFSSFDQIIASGFIVFAYTLWQLGVKQWRRVVLIVAFLATASITSFALHLTTNAWFFGSFDAAFQDLCVNALLDKSTRAIPFEGHEKMVLSAYPVWLARAVWDRYAMSLMGVAGVCASIVFALASAQSATLARRFVTLACIMCVANFSYWVVFPRLNYMQFEMANAAQWLPTYSILLGGPLYFMAVQVRYYWASPGFSKFLVLIPEFLALLCVFQIYLHVLKNQVPRELHPAVAFAEEAYDNASVRLMSELTGQVPKGATLYLSDTSVFQHHLILTPRSAFGLPELPFSVEYVRPSDASGIYHMENLALSQDVYILRTQSSTTSKEQLRENLIAVFKKANVPSDKWEAAIADRSPIEVRPNWEPVRSGDQWGLYKVRTPAEDDLFPERATLPTRLAISGARVRDGHELQLLGWLFTPERASRIEIRLDGEALGDAVYPAPGKELAEKNFEGMRRWFGMQDYPLPHEELAGNYPEYKDNTPRFIFIQRGLRLSPTSHTISVHAYSGDRIVAEASYDFDYVDGTHRIRQYFAVEKPGPGMSQAG